LYAGPLLAADAVCWLVGSVVGAVMAAGSEREVESAASDSSSWASISRHTQAHHHLCH
jgi:hypothetical protein